MNKAVKSSLSIYLNIIIDWLSHLLLWRKTKLFFSALTCHAVIDFRCKIDASDDASELPKWPITTVFVMEMNPSFEPASEFLFFFPTGFQRRLHSTCGNPQPFEDQIRGSCLNPRLPDHLFCVAKSTAMWKWLSRATPRPIGWGIAPDRFEK